MVAFRASRLEVLLAMFACATWTPLICELIERLTIFDLTFERGLLRERAFQRVTIRPLVHNEEQVASLDVLVVPNGQLHDGPVDLRRHADEVRKDLGVVGTGILDRAAYSDQNDDRSKEHDTAEEKPSSYRFRLSERLVVLILFVLLLLVAFLLLLFVLSVLGRIRLRRSGGLVLLHASLSLCLVSVLAIVVCHANLLSVLLERDQPD